MQVTLRSCVMEYFHQRLYSTFTSTFYILNTTTDPISVELSNGGCVERILWYRYHDATSWVVTASHQQLQNCLHAT